MEAYQEWNDVLLTKKEYMFDPDENNHLTGESRGKVFLHKDEDSSLHFLLMCLKQQKTCYIVWK